VSFFYNTDSFIDNDYGALDNETLLAEIKRRADEEAEKVKAKPGEDAYYKRDEETGLSQAQVDAKAAQAEAAEAKRAAEEALKAAQAEQERLKREKAEREAREKAEREATERAEREAREKAEREAREKAASDNNGLTTSLYTPTSTPTYTPSPTPPTSLKTSLLPTPPPPPKTAPIDTILFDEESVPIEVMSDLILENIGGHELINIARNDTINGQIVSYQPIKNLSSIQQQYNPNNIVSLQDTSDRYFANFSIKLETSLIEEGEGSGPDGAYIFIDSDGDLVVELINVDPDQQMEVEISQSGTIYEASI